MPERWFLDTDEKIEHFLAHVRERRSEGRPCTVQFLKSDRSTEQNALFHAILRAVYEQKRDESLDEIKRFCKLRFGVPILRSTDPQFRHLYDEAVKNNLSYEQKLEAMDILPVTSRMNTEQMTEMIESTAQYWVENGFDLSGVRDL